jgi:hypothetical protein
MFWLLATIQVLQVPADWIGNITDTAINEEINNLKNSVNDNQVLEIKDIKFLSRLSGSHDVAFIVYEVLDKPSSN